MKKVILMLLAGAFIVCTTGCPGETPAPKKEKDKEVKKEKDKA